jgi:endonuclease/exonuclease/phosphatase family metal-dependent hydrolase
VCNELKYHEGLGGCLFVASVASYDCFGVELHRPYCVSSLTNFSLCNYKMGSQSTKLLQVPAATLASPAGDQQLTVLTYNTFLRPHIVQNDAQVERAVQMPGVLAAFGADILCLQECWSKFAVHHLTKQLPLYGYTYMVRPKRVKKLKLLPSGLMTCSKHPVTASEFVPFTACSGPDCLATKGFLYTRIQHPTLGSVHVFNIHLQFVTASKLQSTDQKKLSVQSDQLDLWAEFMRQKQFAAQDIVLLAGDWNFDSVQNKPEFQSILRKLQVELPPLQGPQEVSVDPEHNCLVGRGNEARKYGCVSVLYTGEKCTCCPSRWVDFVVYSLKHRQPVQSESTIESVKVKPFHTRWMSACTDLSDHYPVVTSFVF